MPIDKAAALDPLQKRFVEISDGVARHNIPFTLAKRYHALKYVADGSYGVVVRARDAAAPHLRPPGPPEVAIKRCHRCFESVYSAKHLLREARLLAALQHPNILPLHDIDLPGNYAGWTDVYLVTPLLPHTLSSRLAAYAKERPREPLPDAVVRKVLTGLCRALKYMQSANCVHRDLKTANILTQDDWDPVLCDLGLARAIDPEDPNSVHNLTTGVVTRCYRAPELFITPDMYTDALDMWSLGCILHELLDVAQPLFVKKKQHGSELGSIFDVIGTPSEDDMASAFPDPEATWYVRRFMGARGHRRVPVEQRFRCVDPARISPGALQILDGLLVFNPAARLTPNQILNHPYLAETADPAMEIVVSPERREEITAMEPPMKVTKEEVRQALWEEARRFHPKEAAMMEETGLGPSGRRSKARKKEKSPPKPPKAQPAQKEKQPAQSGDSDGSADPPPTAKPFFGFFRRRVVGSKVLSRS